jgi:predicted  nucleic acid-binding Zn-ribbon protein
MEQWMKRAGSAAVLLLFVACASSAPDRAAKAASSLEVMQQNSSKARAQVDTVLSSLNTLLDAPADKLREAFDRYDRDVKKMNELADAIRENDRDLRVNGDKYLKQWQRDTSNISDAELRRIAEERREQIGRSSTSMRSTLTSAAGGFEGFLRNINDIHKVIGNDLTSTGQASVRQTSVAQTAQSEGERAKNALSEAEQAIDGLRSQITPTN